ncbi:recombinase family protein [Demequina zhanjiangensis]|uniref:Recombinase family protein n=1 Tax=Demequina zhanjiangensis TaxID=3051659 RepID=A0ABT8G373_9MICO|nr:recombinase family protein [Demequina sp. SYSU T00b26]MDN4473580.1 recombinase family protein [Demequina sp. SYSU T00b26]
MNKPPGKRAALYLRQSLDRAEGIENQLARCTALANAKGWPVVATFRDNETRASGPRGEGTAWHDMLQRVPTEFEIIVAVDLDRLVRSTKDLNTLIDLGAQVVTVDGEIDLTTADGEFRATMIAGIARFETRRASERQQRHKAGKAERGEWHGGLAPFGYTAVKGSKGDKGSKGSLIKNEREADLIHEAATRLLDGREPMHSIITEWNGPSTPDGTDISKPTRNGKHWRQSNLKHILLNRALLGETKAGVVGWEPILDRRTFDRLSALLTDPSRKVVQSPGVKGGKYSMAGGLTVCSACGKRLTSNTRRRADGSLRVVLSCLARVNGPDPQHQPAYVDVTNGKTTKTVRRTNRVSVDHDSLEAFVFDIVIGRLTRSPRFHERAAERDPSLDADLDRLEAERTELRDQRERAANSYILGLLTESAAKSKVANLEDEIERIDRELAVLYGQQPAAMSVDVEDVVNWRDWPPMKRRAFLRIFIEKVEVAPSRVKRTAPRHSAESEDAHLARREADALAALRSRVRIVWRSGRE